MCACCDRADTCMLLALILATRVAGCARAPQCGLLDTEDEDACVDRLRVQLIKVVDAEELRYELAGEDMDAARMGSYRSLLVDSQMNEECLINLLVPILCPGYRVRLPPLL